MAELAGYGGNLYYDASLSQAVGSIATAVTGVNNWTVNLVGDALETTDFADSGNRTYIAGLKGWTGTATGNYDASLSYNLVDPGTKVSIKFDMGSSKEVIGNVLITGLNFGTAVDGTVTANWTFQGDGAYTIG